ncbi:NADP-dependent oxidoreductase [Serratia plymuthica]|uniref:MDR family NADP-dependent oxidoreductase n=1 Tax=Serratia plymuthica TaxID=82996 RepID=UPI0018D9938F|nr:NADP-dependent oxidoreductase [Serratia plymuthica]QPS88445.1 NADP-dependent oxidoreductase [Serratia plymuthica]
MVFATQHNRKINLLKRSSGMPGPDNFEIIEHPDIACGENEILVRNCWFRVSISTRLMMSEEAESVKGIPFPPINIGDTLADAAIGEIVSAPAASGLQPGEFVLHPFGWREYAAVDIGLCTRLGNKLINPAAYLGHGWTAYAALTRATQVKPDDVVFVSSGAGAIGSMAGQIARKLGAKRVIGSTGTPEKASWMKRELGYDEVIIRGDGTISDQLHRYAPDGIDIFIDIVGGEQLEAAVSHTREGARIVLLGALSAELADATSTKYAPVEIDAFAIIVKGITMRGYSADENPEVFAEWLSCLSQPSWADIEFPVTRFKGLESAPLALKETCSGKARGLVLVAL